MELVQGGSFLLHHDITRPSHHTSPPSSSRSRRIQRKDFCIPIVLTLFTTNTSTKPHLTFQPNTHHNMPRNGDGSSDNGPVEGSEVVHGNSGDVRPPHTTHLPLINLPITNNHDRPPSSTPRTTSRRCRRSKRAKVRPLLHIPFLHTTGMRADTTNSSRRHERLRWRYSAQGRGRRAGQRCGRQQPEISFSLTRRANLPAREG
jgi:hypothetical protein